MLPSLLLHTNFVVHVGYLTTDLKSERLLGSLKRKKKKLVSVEMCLWIVVSKIVRVEEVVARVESLKKNVREAEREKRTVSYYRHSLFQHNMLSLLAIS